MMRLPSRLACLDAFAVAALVYLCGSAGVHDGRGCTWIERVNPFEGSRRLGNPGRPLTVVAFETPSGGRAYVSDWALDVVPPPEGSRRLAELAYHRVWERPEGFWVLWKFPRRERLSLHPEPGVELDDAERLALRRGVLDHFTDPDTEVFIPDPSERLLTRAEVSSTRVSPGGLAANLAAIASLVVLATHLTLSAWRCLNPVVRERRRDSGRCPRCRYTLRGTRGDRCPECGEAVDRRDPSRA